MWMINMLTEASTNPITIPIVKNRDRRETIDFMKGTDATRHAEVIPGKKVGSKRRAIEGISAYIYHRVYGKRDSRIYLLKVSPSPLFCDFPP